MPLIPAGRSSETWTPRAVEGPSGLDTGMVQVTPCRRPRCRSGLVHHQVRQRGHRHPRCHRVVALYRVRTDGGTPAVLVIASAVRSGSMVPETVTVTAAPGRSCRGRTPPTGQVSDPPVSRSSRVLQVGRVSVSSTAVAVDGPRLVTVIVQEASAGDERARRWDLGDQQVGLMGHLGVAVELRPSAGSLLGSRSGTERSRCCRSRRRCMPDRRCR